MLKSSLLILLLVNIFYSNLYYIGISTVILFILNLKYNKDLMKHIRRVKFLFLFYFITCLFQIFYIQEGEVIVKVYNFYLTKEGVINFLLNLLRIFNLLLLSWIVSTQKLLEGRFSKYQNTIETVIELVPEAMIMVKKRMRIKSFFRYILKQIKVKN